MKNATTSTLRIANVFGVLQATLEKPDGTVDVFHLSSIGPEASIIAEVTSFETSLRSTSPWPALLFDEIQAPLRRAKRAVIDESIPRNANVSAGDSLRAIRADWRTVWADAQAACRMAKRARDRLAREAAKRPELSKDAARMASVHRQAADLCLRLLNKRKKIEARVDKWRAKSSTKPSRRSSERAA